MKVVITRDGDGSFVADAPELPGTPEVGRGKTAYHALGQWMHQHAALVRSAPIEVQFSAVAAEGVSDQEYAPRQRENPTPNPDDGFVTIKVRDTHDVVLTAISLCLTALNDLDLPLDRVTAAAYVAQRIKDDCT